MSFGQVTPDLVADPNVIPLPDPTTLAGQVQIHPDAAPPNVTDLSHRTAPSVIPNALPMSRFALTKQVPVGPAAPGINAAPPPAPGYMQSSTDRLTGQPTVMNPSLTKLGKLLTVLRAAGQGAEVGSTQPTFGQGAMAEQKNQNEQINQHLQQAQAEQNLQYLPLMKTLQAQQMRSKMNLQEAQADRAESAANRWGKPTQVGGRMMAANPDTGQLEDVGPAGKPATKEMGDRTFQYDASAPPGQQWKDVGPAKGGTVTPYGKIPPEVFGMLGPMPTSSKYEGKDYGDVRGAQQAWGRDAMGIKNNEAKAKAAGYATTRGQVVTDTETGVTAPVDWATLHDAPPGKYVSPQYDPDTRLKVKAYQDLAPSGKVGGQVTSYNTFLRHTGDLYDAIDTLKNSGYPDWNKNLNWLRTHTGDPRVKTFLAKLDPVQKEFQSFLLGGHALYSEDRESAKNIIDENASPEQMLSALQSIIHTGGARLAETNETFKRATGDDIPDLISPEAQRALAKVGGPQAAAQVPPSVPRQRRITGGGGNQPSAPPAPGKHPVGLVPF